MATEAQKKAVLNYRKRAKGNGTLKRVALDFYPPEKELYKFLEQHKPISTYIKQLVLAEMEKENDR